MGSAATLGGVSAAGLAGGSALVADCDADGFTISYLIENGLVESVTLGGIADPGCEGGSMRVTLIDTNGASIGNGGPSTVPTDGDATANSLTLTIAAQPAASAVKGIRVVVTGP